MKDQQVKQQEEENLWQYICCIRNIYKNIIIIILILHI